MRDVPSKPSNLWIKTVIDLQEELGATVLLTPTGWVTETNGSKALTRMLAIADETRNIFSDRILWTNLTFDAKWLTDTSLRNTLIDEIVESDQLDWYLRFWWPEVNPRYGQLQEAAILNGYKDLVRAAELEGKRVYLPNSGLSGWILTAIGAAGFSTGQSWDEQAFAAQRIIRRAKGQKPSPRIPRLFDPTILHTIEHSEHQRLEQMSGHLSTRNPYLDEIDQTGHTAERASLHYLYEVAGLTAAIAGKRAARDAHARVKVANQFVNSLARIDQLTGINVPGHLKLWPKILR